MNDEKKAKLLLRGDEIIDINKLPEFIVSSVNIEKGLPIFEDFYEGEKFNLTLTLQYRGTSSNIQRLQGLKKVGLIPLGDKQ